MDKQFAASEVRRLSNRIPRSNDEIADAQEALRAFADLLEAREKAVPVAWRTFDGEGNYDYRDYENNEHYRDRYVSRNGAKYANWVEPLYSHPAPADAERLAEALRNLVSEWVAIADDGDATLEDSTIGYRACANRLSAMLAAHSAQAQPPAASVTDAMVNAAMRADFCGHNVADALMCGTDWNTEVMRAALEAALAAQENPNG